MNAICNRFPFSSIIMSGLMEFMWLLIFPNPLEKVFLIIVYFNASIKWTQNASNKVIRCKMRHIYKFGGNNTRSRSQKHCFTPRLVHMYTHKNKFVHMWTMVYVIRNAFLSSQTYIRKYFPWYVHDPWRTSMPEAIIGGSRVQNNGGCLQRIPPLPVHRDCAYL